MELKNDKTTLLKESFMVITDNWGRFTKRLIKLEGGVIGFCRQGVAQVNIDLKDCDITKNTQIVLLPKTIIRINAVSNDFSISIFSISDNLFRESCFRMEPRFIGFLKENPCYVIPVENTYSVDGLMRTVAAIYADKENRFRNQMVKNQLQCFMLDIYDKCYRFFPRQKIEGSSRQDEIFRNFMVLIHEYCTSEREVTFYASKLCISSKYLTGICRSITGDSAKMIIDDFAVLEIKVLLQSTELSIQEIADRLDYPDQSYLGRYFKRHEGISPKEYRINISPTL